jgi:hypothetical protein
MGYCKNQLLSIGVESSSRVPFWLNGSGLWSWEVRKVDVKGRRRGGKLEGRKLRVVESKRAATMC